MQPVSDALVYIVDDDASVRDALAWLLRTRRLLSEGYDSAESFARVLKPNFVPSQPCCLLLDVRMPGMSGLALFEQLVQRGLTTVIPVIFLTGHADVPTAVDAVKRGAFDFCPKPFSDNLLVDRIEQALQQSAKTLALQHAHISLLARVAELTERERDVMQRVVEGLPNKLIADQLSISVRTVEVHRARVFDKMDVKSAVELANMLRNLQQPVPALHTQ
jgi:two-component system response regulator DctR